MYGDTVLHTAAMLHVSTNVMRMLTLNGADINARNKEGVTPLEIAVQKQNLNTVKLLPEDLRNKTEAISVFITSEITEDVIPTIPEEYTLPTASNSVLGGVKVDNDTITIDSDGIISVSNSGHVVSVVSENNFNLGTMQNNSTSYVYKEV